MFRRIRYIAEVFWQFRYYLLCTGLALAFWDTALIKPFRFFVVLVHEVNHAAAALITGGEVLEIRTHWNESGHTLTKGGFFPLISAAGYVGSALWGALLMYTSLYPQAQRLVLLCIGAACAGMTLFYTPLEAGGVDFVLGIGGGLVLCLMACKSKTNGEHRRGVDGGDAMPVQSLRLPARTYGIFQSGRTPGYCRPIGE